MNDETQNITPLAPPTLSSNSTPTPGNSSKRKLIIGIIAAVVVIGIAITLVLSSGKKGSNSNTKTNSNTAQSVQSKDAELVSKLKSLDACSLLTGNVLTQNSLSIDEADNVGLDYHDYAHCVWQSIVNNQLQYQIEATVIPAPVNDILVPTPVPIGSQSKVGSHQTYLTLGDYGNGHGVCIYNIEITKTARVELEARATDDTFEGGCSIANQYGPVLEQSLTAKGF